MKIVLSSIVYMISILQIVQSFTSTRFQNNIKTRSSKSLSPVNAMMPGSPIIVGTLTQGLTNGIGLFSNLLLVRFALSWFPQITGQFPILRPIFTVSEPYLKVFRSQIPPIAGFDISAIPALFCLDILSQTVAAIGAELPPNVY